MIEKPMAQPKKAAEGEWKLEAGDGTLVPRSALDVLTSLNERVASGGIEDLVPIATGFVPMDKTIGGGLRQGELMLIGGAQGQGKTTMALQMARNMAASGQATVLYLCFEHDEEYLIQRMVAMESALAHLPQKSGAVKIQDVKKEVVSSYTASAETGTRAKLGANPRLRPSLERIARYGSNLFLMRGTATHSTIENMRALVQEHRGSQDERRLVLFVDYLQKVPVFPEPADEAEKVTRIVSGLKDIALAEGVPVVAIVAADREGLKAKRLRNHHLRGSSAINYESDIILILNDKYNIVAKVNIEFNPYQAQRYRDWVVATIEKNRGGQDNVDLEYEKLFEYSCFDPTGRITAEKLIEERLYND
ncbi:MAG: AAA family ATPase [Chloroflexi bacterium]|nr:AAA family ATPase [Chloroflexota bacterium]